MLCWHLSVFWSLSPQYQYGWLVPPLAVYLLFRRWKTVPDAESLGGQQGAAVAASACALLLLPLWLVRTATPDWSVITFCLAAAVTGLTLALIARMGGWSVARRLAFPILFIFCAVPWPQRMENWIIQSLMRTVAGVTAELLLWCGIAAEQKGNLVQIGQATLGISEACSGVRSLQSMLMASLFLGELWRFGKKARAILVVAGLAFALFFNLVRNTFLALIAYRAGSSPAFEWWHDSAGWSILLVSFLCLLLVAKYLGKPLEIKERAAFQFRSLPAWITGGFTLWFLLVIGGNEYWYRSHEQGSKNVELMEIHPPVGKDRFRTDPISDRARDVTLCSEADGWSWLETPRNPWTLISLRWKPGRTASQSARVHQPDVCLQASGAIPVRELSPVSIAADGGVVLFHAWLFMLADHPLYVFYNLREEGNRDQWNATLNQDWSAWSRVQRAMVGERNLGQQSIEIALQGYDSQADALDALKTRLPSLITLTHAEK